MTTATIRCTHCGTTTQIPVTSVLVDVGGRTEDENDGGTVSWVCATCGDVVSQPVQWSLLLILVAAGAPLFDEYDEYDEYDDRPVHPEAPPAGPPLTQDDLLDLHALLARTSWFAELESSLAPRPADSGTR